MVFLVCQQCGNRLPKGDTIGRVPGSLKMVELVSLVQCCGVEMAQERGDE